MPTAPLILVLALGLLVAGCGGSSDDSSGGSTDTTTEVADTTVTTPTATSPGGCTDVDIPPPRADGGAKAPKERLDPEKTYNLAVKTNCGSFTITLDLAKAPATTASLVSLAKSGFYDAMIFHRIIPGFVIQGGDPTQSGSGGAGYQTVDPPPSDASYTEGVVAMAKTSAEPAGTSSSQFFVVSGGDAATLPPDYAIVGNVTSGIGVVERIGELGDPSGQPTRPVVIESVTVEEQ